MKTTTVVMKKTDEPVDRRFVAWVEQLDKQFIERQAAVRLVLLALAHGTHVLLLGPPGTAKTQLAAAATHAVGGNLFSTLLTKFSAPEDLFGPISLPELDSGVYRRLVKGYLPSVEVAFVDEIFKANASILNSLLSILNERKYFNGATPEDVPLVSLLGASNEVPEPEDGLDALDDRLLLRARVDYIADDAEFARLLQRPNKDDAAQAPPALDATWREQVKAKAQTLSLSDSVADALLHIRRSAREAQLQVSDRRYRQIADVMRTMAAIDGSESVTDVHLGILNFALWRRPEEQRTVQSLLEKCWSAGAEAADLKKMLNELVEELNNLDQRLRNAYYTSDRQSIAAQYSEQQKKQQNIELRVVEHQQRCAALHEGPQKMWSAFWRSAMDNGDLSELLKTVKNHAFHKKTAELAQRP